MLEEKSTSLPTSIFVTIFLSIVTYLLFFAESSYLFWAYFSLVVLYLGTIGYRLRSSSKPIHRYDARLGVFVTFILLIALSLNQFSLSIPHGLYRWLLLALGGLTFLFFSSGIGMKRHQYDILIIGTTIPAFILFIWNIILLLVPNLGTSLPSNTLLTASYGHNHIYIYYLYALLIHLHYQELSKEKILWNATLTVLTLGVLLSFSRAGVFFLTIILLYTVIKRRRQHPRAIVSAVISGLFLLLFIVLSASPSHSYGDNCILPIYKVQLCKSFHAEGRLEYWRQAVVGIKNSPLIGNGGGTFSITSSQNRREPEFYTSMPHNEYLQLVYEYGIVGWVLTGSVITALIFIFIKRKKASPLVQTLILFLFISSVDAIFNYNWNFSAFLLLYTMVLAIVLRELYDHDLHHKRRLNFVVVYLASFVGIAVPFMYYTGSYMIAESALKDDPVKYVQVFPYLEWYAKEALKSSQLEPATRAKLEKFYTMHRGVGHLIIERAPDNSLEKKHALEHAITLDPFDEKSRIALVQFGISTDNYDVIIQQLDWFLAFYPPDDQSRILQQDVSYLETLVSYANQLASNNPSAASEITLRAFTFEPWRANSVDSVFFTSPENFDPSYVERVLSVPKLPILHRYLDSIVPWYSEQARLAAQQNNWERMNIFTKKTLEIADWQRWDLWEDISAVFQTELESSQLDDDVTDKDTAVLLQRWTDFLELLKTHGNSGEEYAEWAEHINAYQ